MKERHLYTCDYCLPYDAFARRILGVSSVYKPGGVPGGVVTRGGVVTGIANGTGGPGGWSRGGVPNCSDLCGIESGRFKDTVPDPPCVCVE